jgi:competence protein ComEC
MLQTCLALLAGAYALQLFTSLPPAGLLVVVVAAAAFCIVNRRLRLAGYVLIGFCVAWHASAKLLDDRLPDDLQGSTIEITGRVAGFPEQRGESLRFVLQTSDADRLPSRVRLAWYDVAVQPAIGETWRLKVRLRKPRGFANPVGFDYEQWLFRQGIGATGYVVQHPENRLLEEVPVATFDDLRRSMAERISSVAGDNDAAAVLLAITVGARHRISQQQWEQYAITGTSHLMAISGLHIGLAAGGAFVLFWIGLAPLCRWANLRDRAALMAALVAVVYAAVSGFAVPAQRAMLMALLVVAASLLRRQAQPEMVLAAAAMVVFLTEPIAILSPGFKLSFAAVAILLWSARQRCFTVPGKPSFGGQLLEGMKRLPPLQLTLLFGLFPMTALIFGRVAWLAPLVNLLVLPVFNLLTVPAALLGLLLDGPLRMLGDGLLRVSWLSVRGMLWLISGVATWRPARIDIATASPMLIPLVLLAALWAILPPGWPGRRVAWIAGLCAVLLRPAAVPPGCLDLTVLDVGQGQGQAWLWDGVRFSVMHPGLYPLTSDNNASCVLEVAAGPHKVLLTGDIESPVERHLARTRSLMPVDIVIVPHHGSGTSSAPAFVQALEPAVAIVSAGYRNRWGFPKEEVVRRWEAVGARLVSTALSGAVQYRLCADREPERVWEHRVRHRKYWHGE